MDKHTEAIARGWAQAQIETKDALAIAIAERSIAQMDYDNAVAGVDAPAPAAETDIIVEQFCPILGRIQYLPGRIISIEHPRTNDDIVRDRERGLDIAIEWSLAPHTARKDIGVVRLYIGMESTGPTATWSRDGKWHIILSRGNYGKNWACGGNWRNLNPIKDAEKVAKQIGTLPQELQSLLHKAEEVPCKKQ